MSLRFEDYEIPSAKLGKLDPLPDLGPGGDAHADIAIDAGTVTEEERRYMGWARADSILPYLIQDGYDRVRKPHRWHAAILENENLRAVFLPQLGGRLWSLYDKRAGRELLYRNPVFQPCNLAPRNAWFAGGVEWSCGGGHAPYTCDRMYCEQLSLSDGTPVVRMYQYERARGLIYRVEAFLPEGARQLYVRVRLDNALRRTAAACWWSNIAVAERDDLRVIAPASGACRPGCGASDSLPVPAGDGLDVSYPARLPQPEGLCFDLDAGRSARRRSPRRWICAVDGDGRGLVQTSTDLLRGRGLFAWGRGARGRDWQAFLAAEGCRYIEMQAGLTRAQLEQLPLDAGATLSWLEAYGPICVDAARAHSHDWAAAQAEVARALEACCPRAGLDALHERCAAELDEQQGELRQLGAGWARLEQEALDGEFDAHGLRFPIKSLRQPERQWLALIERGTLPRPHPLDEPLGYQIGAHWQERLLKSIARGGGHWYCYYQLGVLRAHAGDADGARDCFEKSLAADLNPWALRCLALMDGWAGDAEGAARRLQQAVALKPEYHIALEALAALRRLRRYMAMIDVYSNLPHTVRARGRIRAEYCAALIEVGMLAHAEEVLRGGIKLPDARVGESVLPELWFSLCAHKLARARGVECDAALLDEARRTATLPEQLDVQPR